MTKSIRTVAQYLASLPEDRRAALNAVRKVILANLPEGYEETMQYGMIGYVVPHRLYPAGYHCKPEEPLPYAALGAQKSHFALHLMAAYGDAATDAWFRKTWLATGKKLDMGKACVRFKKVEDVPLEVIGQMMARVPVKQYVARVERMLSQPREKRGR
jgi:uncharacterized protein YdhG (YjbR/CyaY superfamily)